MKPTVETVKLTVIGGRIGSMSTLTITEFLEARIAEDEAEAGWRAADRASRASVVGGIVPDLVTPERMLAECAAKRAIIVIFKDRCPEVFDGERWVSPLAALAVVYADHPDYQQEWAL